jgi:hypothetical protein
MDSIDQQLDDALRAEELAFQDEVASYHDTLMAFLDEVLHRGLRGAFASAEGVRQLRAEKSAGSAGGVAHAKTFPVVETPLGAG